MKKEKNKLNKISKIFSTLATVTLLTQALLTPVSVFADELDNGAKTEISSQNEFNLEEITRPLGYLASANTAIGFTDTGKTILSSVNEFQRATGNSAGKATKYYGGYATSTAYITVGGVPAVCINPDLPFPLNHEYIEEIYHDVGVFNIMYYALENGYDKAESTYVDWYVAINYYLGHFTSTAMASDPSVAFLLDKAHNPTAPNGSFDIKNKNQEAVWNNVDKRQETGWYENETTGSNQFYTITVNDGLTAILSDGRTLGAGIHNIDTNVQFKLTADARFEGTVTFDVPTNVKPQTPLIFKPVSGNVQNLMGMDFARDPITVQGVSAKFVKRLGNGSFKKVSKETNQPMANVKYDVAIGTDLTEATTDENGEFSFNDILDGTVIKVKEKATLDGYVLDDNEYSLTIVAGETTKLNLTNEVQQGRIKGYKQIEVFNAEETEKQGKPVYDTKPASKITFDVTALNDITLPDGSTVKANKGDIVDTVTTNEKGYFESTKDLWVGKQNNYRLIERDVPENYRKPSDIQANFTIPYGVNTEKLITYDTGSIDNLLKTGTWNFNKRNELTTNLLDDAKFLVEGISKHNKDVSFIFLSSELGNIFKLKAGNYKVTEIGFPDGFGQSIGESETKIITIKDNEATVTDWNNAPVDTKKPKMGTQAYAENGGKDFDPAVDNKLYDKIKNENYDDDTKYFVTKVIGEKTGTIYFESKGEQTLDENGEIIVETFIPAGTVQKENIYFVEEAYNSKKSFEKGEKPYTEHDGKNDYGQTLFYKEKQVVPVTPTNPIQPLTLSTPVSVVQKQKLNNVVTMPKLPQTGENITALTLIVGMFTAIAGTLIYMSRRKLNNK